MESEETLIAWWSWPALRQPTKALFSWAVVLFSLFICAQWNVFLTIGLGMALLSALSEILLPSFYQVRKNTLRIFALHTHQKIPWSSIESFIPKDHGYLIQFTTSRSQKKNLFLYCNSNKEKIGLILEQFIFENKT